MKQNPIIFITMLFLLMGPLLSNLPLFIESAIAAETSAKDKYGSDGEHIYFTGLSRRGTEITSTDGPLSADWLMVDDRFACVSCHGPSGEGNIINLAPMVDMFVKDIRGSALETNYDAEKFKTALTKGQKSDGDHMNLEMPRWTMSDDDLTALFDFLKTLRP